MAVPVPRDRTGPTLGIARGQAFPLVPSILPRARREQRCRDRVSRPRTRPLHPGTSWRTSIRVLGPIRWIKDGDWMPEPLRPLRSEAFGAPRSSRFVESTFLLDSRKRSQPVNDDVRTRQPLNSPRAAQGQHQVTGITVTVQTFIAALARNASVIDGPSFP